MSIGWLVSTHPGVGSRDVALQPSGAPTSATPKTAPGAAPSTTLEQTTTTNANGATGVLATPAIQGYLASRTGNVTAAVYDVTTGATSLWRPGVTEYTASIEKVDILAALLYRQQELGAELTSSQEWLAETMIENSDNNSANDLWVQAGENPAIASFNKLAGLTSTVLNPQGYWGLTTTTALDQVRLLKVVAFSGTVLSGGARSYELSLMEDVDAGENWGISAGPTAGTTIALKNGWLPLQGESDWQVNSIGWVDGHGRDYLIAVLTNANPTEAYGIATVEGVSSLIWSAMAG